MAAAGPGPHRRGVSFGAAARARAPARRASAVLAALALAAAACAGPRRGGPPEPALRIWTPRLVFWSGKDRTLAVGLENGTTHAVKVEAPEARRARVILYLGPGEDRVCGHDADPAGPPGPAVSLAPGELRGLRVDLESACGRLPPGEYRYEVGYEAPAVGPGPNVRLRTSHGHVVIAPAREPTAGP